MDVPLVLVDSFSKAVVKKDGWYMKMMENVKNSPKRLGLGRSRTVDFTGTTKVTCFTLCLIKRKIGSW